MKEKDIWIRLDGDALAALRVLTRDGRSRSAAIGDALLESARRSDQSALAAEAAAVAKDGADRCEMEEVAAVMGSLRVTV